MFRSGHVATDDLTSIQVAFANFVIDEGNHKEMGSAATTTYKASLEYPIGSARQPILFSGVRNGVAVAVSGSGATNEQGILISDSLTVATLIPKGANFRIWYTMASSAGLWYRGATAEADHTLGDALDVTGADVVDSGTFSDQGFWCPTGVCAIIGPTNKHSVALVGDSIVREVTGYVANDGRVGLLAPSIPTDTAFVNLASSSSTAQTYLSESPGRQQLFPYCSIALIELGRNDLNLRTAAQIGADVAAIAAVFPSRVSKVACTLIPDTSSTDGFITSANQTLPSYEATREDYNTNYVLAHAMSGIAYSLDTLSVVGSANKWVHEAGARTVTDGSISSTVNTNLFTSATANFTSADIGYGLRVVGAGIGGVPLQSWILDIVSTTQVHISGQNSSGQGFASTTVSGATCQIGGITMDGVHPIRASADLIAASGIFNLANYPAPV